MDSNDSNSIKVTGHQRPKFIDDLISLYGDPQIPWSDTADSSRMQYWRWTIGSKHYTVVIEDQSGQFDRFVTSVDGYGSLILEWTRYPTYAQLRDMSRVVGFPEGTEPQVAALEETSEIPLDDTPQT